MLKRPGLSSGRSSPVTRLRYRACGGRGIRSAGPRDRAGDRAVFADQLQTDVACFTAADPTQPGRLIKHARQGPVHSRARERAAQIDAGFGRIRVYRVHAHSPENRRLAA